MKRSLQNFIGIDVDLEISLFEYNVICEPYIKDGRTDEYFCLYKQNNLFGSSYITEEFLNDLVNAKEWMDEDNVLSFLETNGIDKETFLDSPFIVKLSDLISYHGVENILGVDYDPLTKKELKKLYNF